MYRFKPLESKLLHKTGYQNPLQGKKNPKLHKKNNNIKAFITAASTCKRWTRANSAHMVLALKTFGLTGQRPTSSLQRERDFLWNADYRFSFFILLCYTSSSVHAELAAI